MSRRHLHFMGAGGVGMCGLAEVSLDEGRVVSGCDLAASDRTERLVALGAAMHVGHDPSHLEGVDALVMSAAVDPSHPEVEEARHRGLPIVRRSELLGEMMRCRRGIAVAGTHGKTTTTALLGHILTGAGCDPTVLVGGRARFLQSHGRLGAGDLMVCEADEYDRSFLELSPRIAVITNLEPEHLDCYRDHDQLTEAFVEFANRCSTFGCVVCCVDDPGARGVRTRLRRRVVGYGESSDAHVRAVDPVFEPAGTRFAVTVGGREIGEVGLPLLGRHNVANALAAIAVGLELGISFDVLAAHCADFGGVARRFEIVGQRDGVTVIDDYAHHPTELRAVLRAARQALPGRRLVAVFQPHLYSRTRDFAGEFAEALMAAEVAVLMPVYPAREEPIPGVSTRIVAEAAEGLGHPVVVEPLDIEDAVRCLDRLVEPEDVVLTMGAGDVDRVGAGWLGEER
jgi:UDP-N-acetylmuramate--alanine ligase